MRATVEMSNPHRRTSSSPACGPVPVTTVPVTSAAAVSAPSEPGGRSRTATRQPGPVPARHRRASDRDEGERDRAHRQQEVRLDERRVQVGAHGDAPDDPVAEHGDQHAERRSDEATSRRRSDPERPDRHRQRRDADEPAQQAVHLLDGGVPARHVDERLRRCSSASRHSPGRFRSAGRRHRPRRADTARPR